MTMEEAIAQLKLDRDLCNFNPMTGEEEPMNEDCRKSAEALDIAMKALEQEPKTGRWIPCNERLPKDDKKQYIVQKTNGFIDILGFTKDAYKLDRYDFAEYKDKNKQLFYEYDSEYGYIEWKCEAWMPLPEPYKAESEDNK